LEIAAWLELNQFVIVIEVDPDAPAKAPSSTFSSIF
jgi:hypothetical protein